jgi:hypothetical protein
MVAKLIAGTLVFGALAMGAAWPIEAAPASNTAVETPDFSGIWDRGNESWFHAVPGATDGKPLVRISNNPQQEAGDYNNPILQPWVRDIVKANAEKELRDEYVPTAHGSCSPSGVPEVLNLREGVEFLQQWRKVESASQLFPSR